MNYKYMKHLLLSLEGRMETIRSEMGKTDIEPPDYEEKISKWHKDLLEKICEKEPEGYVKSINIYENGPFEISYIEYVYLADDSKTSTASINIFDAEDSI